MAQKSQNRYTSVGDKFLEGYRRKYKEIMYGTEGAE